MKRIMSCLCICLLLCFTATACTTSNEEEIVIPKNQIYRVLFIGNSYTYYNDLWDIFENMAQSVGYTIEADHVTQGGYYLDQYTNTADPFGAQVESYLAENSYDAVFLQEQSTCPIQNYDRFEAGVVTLNEKIRANGADCILYQTWGRQSGSSTLTALGRTNQGMTEDLIAAYQQAADVVGATVSPVGAAFYDVYTTHSEIELYDPDTSHPSPAGSYLAALCHLATFTGIDPQEIPFNADLDEATAAVLKQAAKTAVHEVSASSKEKP